MPTTGRLNNKTCIITGSSGGLGRAIALRFASEGARVVCADLVPTGPPTETNDGAEQKGTDAAIREKHGDQAAIFVKCDVSEAKSMEELVRRGTEFGGGRLDVMVNNAGIYSAASKCPIHELDEGIWDVMMKINARGVFLGCKYACRQFLKQDLHPDNGQRGWIVNTASVLAFIGMPDAAAYCAAKGAVMQLTKSMAVDYAPQKIHCNAICPGFMQTNMTTGFRADESANAGVMSLVPMKEWGQPDDIASAAVFLASDDARFVTGTGLVVDGGLSAWKVDEAKCMLFLKM
ncbi:MAG: hypothetical protein M4579_003546 [Chaenotheca gracillima]|nr:MAG: hypothetical protein M4579_003546 [Chaenotheca gracillima]